MYCASCVVWKKAHSAILDDATFISEESRLIPIYHPIENRACAIWTNHELHYQNFPIPKIRLTKGKFPGQGRELKAGGQNAFNLLLDSTEEV